MKIQQIMTWLTGSSILDGMLEEMAEKLEDFAGEQSRYNDTLHILEQALEGEDGAPSVREEAEAIHRQAASYLLFSAALGLKANLDRFENPVSGNFLEVDPEIYLRENTARELPEYKSAQQVRDRFRERLTPQLREVHLDICAYTAYLETAVPKLAHYYGYLLGNTLLRHIVAGYHPDLVQTTQYRAFMEDYFGCCLR